MRLIVPALFVATSDLSENTIFIRTMTLSLIRLERLLLLMSVFIAGIKVSASQNAFNEDLDFVTVNDKSMSICVYNCL